MPWPSTNSEAPSNRYPAVEKHYQTQPPHLGNVCKREPLEWENESLERKVVDEARGAEKDRQEDHRGTVLDNGGR